MPKFLINRINILCLEITDKNETVATKNNFDQNNSDWDKLPDLILETIFSYLSTKEKYWASLTCKNWHRAFYSPKTWSTFILDDYTLTRKKFNYYSGWQHVLDHYRTMQCLSNIGCYIRYLIFKPMMNFYNLYEFMNMFSYYAEEGEKNKYPVKRIGHLIKGLKFVFPCTMRQKAKPDSVRIFGTGGQILGSLKRLMSNLTSLKILELVDLMLESNDAKFLLDDICNNCYLKLKNLVIINTTKEIFPLIHPGVLLNLNILVISPQNLCDDLVHLLGFTSIQHLHIKSNLYSMATEACEPISYKIWEQTKKQNPTLAVHLEGMDEIFWQNGAPVKSLIFNGNKKMIQADTVMRAIEQYDNSLEAFIFNGMPRFYRSKSFHDRADNSLMFLCHQCPNLSILVIHERISTATILLIASTLKSLKYLIVRRNAVIIKMDWPKRHNWSDDFYIWMKTNSKKYELVEQEISTIMGYRWKMLTDKEFKNLKIKPYKSKLSSSTFKFIFN